MCYSAASGLSLAPAAVQRARLLVVEALGSWGVDDSDSARELRSDAALVVSELVTNALRVSGRHLSVYVEAHFDFLEIGVDDDSRSQPFARWPSAAAEGGRGLTIVSSLASSWGVRTGEHGKTVWCRLPVPPGSVLARGCKRFSKSEPAP